MDEFEGNFLALIEGRLAESAAESFLLDMAEGGETADHLVTAATIMRTRAVKTGPFPGAIDLCGTGGDGAGTVNVSTASALITAACGVKIAKHGNRAASSQSGSSDVLQALGVPVAANQAEAEAHYEVYGITFLNAADFHPTLAALAPLRRRLGRRTIFNLLGPLLNPAGVRRQLVGVYAQHLLPVFAEALRRLGSEHVWVVHGGGLDELSVTGESEAAIIKEGQMSQLCIDPADLGLNRWTQMDLRGGSPAENAAALEAMLQGARGAYRDIAVLNAGAALIVGGKAETLAQGLTMAFDAIDSGAALDLLQRMRQQRL